MDKIEYIKYIDNEIRTLLKEEQLANYKNQIFAWRLNASFNRTYKPDYLWNRAIFLSSNCAYLLQNEGDKKIIISGLKTSGEIFEYLSEIDEITQLYDKESVLILSALCYDLSGYQANAYCIATRIGEFSLVHLEEEKNLDPDNYIVRQITNILLKKLPLANSIIQADSDLGISLFNNALSKWFESIFRLRSKNNYLEAFELTYQYYLNCNNIFISQLLFLLKARLTVYDDKSIWLTLNKINGIEKNQIWRKYVKLLAYDYYSSSAIKQIDQRKSIYELWTSQQRAIEQGLLEKNENFVVQMPTSAGKTFIAELSILKHLTEFPDKKCIYIAPFRALTSEKEIELSRYFSKLGYSVSALSGSYEVDTFQDVIISQTDILIATPEKVDLLLRVNPDIFDEISLMVVDEGHIIGEISTRASLLEFLIIRLKIKLPDLKLLFISAVMPPKNANEYAVWLSGKDQNVLRSLQFSDSPVSEEWEPTRKLIGSFSWSRNNGQLGFKNFEEKGMLSSIGNPFVPNYLKAKEIAGRFPSSRSKPETTAALAYKMSFEGNTLVYCSQPRLTKSIANPLLEIIKIVRDDLPEWFDENEDKESYFYSKMWYGEDSYITKAIKRGIGVHFGDMPEQVRNSVEHDYRNGQLRILLSSNTVGQGLNFPIKNLIFYNLSINFVDKKLVNISKRDFWNIVGRAGRAGKETEGKVIFVINTNLDLETYNEFTDKDNLEAADSLFYKVINAFYKGRLSSSEMNNQLEILSETYLLDLFTEEIFNTDYEEVINKIIDNSLFKIQIENNNYDLKYIRNSFRKSLKKIEENLSIDEASIYKLSGFSYKSNLIIDSFVLEHKEHLHELLIGDDYLAFLKVYFEFVLDSNIAELADEKLKKIGLTVEEHYTIMEMWVIGMPLETIIKEWKEEQTIEQFHLFLAKGLFYLYPWGLTAFMNILIFRLDIESDEIPENIKNLSSYLKYGLNDSTACLARSLGIKNRDVVLLLLPLSRFKVGSDFIKWLSNISAIKVRNLDISEFDKENILTVSRRLTPKRFNKLPDILTFDIQGTEDRKMWRDRSRQVEIGSELTTSRRSYNNEDPYGIHLLFNNRPIGRIPAEYSKILSAEMDINDAEYFITVTEVIVGKHYNTLTVALVDSLF
nr:DEAD/DEAH box helicase [uncultured Flavobacterium sp.]